MGSLIGERVKSLRDECTGRWPVHFFGISGIAIAALALAAAPAHAVAASAPASPPQGAVTLQSVDDFYRGRNNYPLWLAPNAGDSAQQLLNLLSTANLDGLDPGKYRVPELQAAIGAAKSDSSVIFALSTSIRIAFSKSSINEAG